MRTNSPVTSHEIELGEDTIIVSKTNLKGQISYVNRDFILISGFDESELIGEPHNIVRHPDMPEEAFADLWRCLKEGRPWVGMVKNRCKNGDYYWVEAHASPIYEGSSVVGYMSVRRKAERAKVAAASEAYAKFKSGNASGLTISNGAVVSVGHGGGWLKSLSVSGRLNVLLVGLVAMMGLVAASGVFGLRQDKQSLANIQAEHLSPVTHLAAITELIGANRGELLIAFNHDPANKYAKLHDHAITKHTDLIAQNAAEITSHFDAYEKQVSSPEHKAVYEKFKAARTEFAAQGLIPALALLKDGKFDDAMTLRAKMIDPAYMQVRATATELIAWHQKEAVRVREESAAAADRMRNVVISLLLASAILAWLCGRGVTRSILVPLESARNAFLNIGQGRFDSRLDLTLNDEIGKVLQGLESMQTRMGFDMVEAKRAADEMTRIKLALDNAGTPFRIADEGGTVVYANARMVETLQKIEGSVQDYNPAFRAAEFVGSNIGAIFREPSGYNDQLLNLSGLVKKQIEFGELTFDISTMPVINARGERLGSVAEWVDRTEELKIEREKKRVADEMARIKIALDNVSTGVMIANAEREIIYVNNSVVKILKGAESEIRKQLPNFNVDKLVGTNIDVFHKNPAHQATLLANLNGVHTAALKIGTRHMVVVANPVVNAAGERLGAVAEWKDRTAEVEIEKEVADIIAAAGRGDFTTRLSLDGKDGFFKQLSEGMNQLSGVVSSGLTDVATALKAIAQGDLTKQITGDYEGLFGQLKDDTNTTVERLKEVIGRIKDATEAINTASQEIAAGNADLSSRTEEQASSLEETASSMEELSSTVKQNAENAKQANELAQQSNQAVVRGGASVQRVVSTMTDIQSSSKKIADIIGVIDSIAFQTNILALNAAVEAARAGEQGRGFAVVASEVRSLAQRSATAAKEIKELIAESVSKVDSGAKLVEEAGTTMQEVVTSFGKVATLVTDITNASREQASGIEQVSQAVGQMDEVTQQNAALVEEAAAAAESLEEQARGLVQAVAMFKLEEGAGRGMAPVTRQLARPASKPVSPVRGGGRPIASPQAMAGSDDDEWKEF